MDPKGTPYSHRSLKTGPRGEYHRYKVFKKFTIKDGKTAPWFGKPGEGTQLYGITKFSKKMSIEQLINRGYLKEY